MLGIFNRDYSLHIGQQEQAIKKVKSVNKNGTPNSNSDVILRPGYFNCTDA